MTLTEAEAQLMLHSFDAINQEYYGNNKDAFRLIAPHTRCCWNTPNVATKNMRRSRRYHRKEPAMQRCC
jgi:hypothetical protein